MEKEHRVLQFVAAGIVGCILPNCETLAGVIAQLDPNPNINFSAIVSRGDGSAQTFTPEISVAGGVSISELEPLTPGTDSQMANAAVASINFDRRWTDERKSGYAAKT